MCVLPCGGRGGEGVGGFFRNSGWVSPPPVGMGHFGERPKVPEGNFASFCLLPPPPPPPPRGGETFLGPWVFRKSGWVSQVTPAPLPQLRTPLGRPSPQVHGWGITPAGGRRAAPVMPIVADGFDDNAQMGRLTPWQTGPLCR